VLRVAHTTRSLVFLAFGAGAVLAVGVLFATWQALTGRIEADQLQRLSDTGQAASAILSAIALMGIAGSLYFQMQQTRTERIAAARGLRDQLLLYAIDRPQLLHLWGVDSTKPTTARQEAAYVSTVVAYIKTSYVLDLLTDHELREYCRLVFAHEAVREFWRDARQTYLNDRFPAARRFARTVDELYQHTVDRPAPPTPTPRTSPEIHVPTVIVAATASFAAGITIAAMAACRQRRSAAPLRSRR
jgi:hypothetical protein